MKKNCPGCGSSLVHHAEAAASAGGIGHFQWCNNPRCPRRSLCAVCRHPLRPITEPIPCAKAQCTNEACSRFGWEIDDNWPGRYAA
jgi:hypothetical protein